MPFRDVELPDGTTVRARVSDQAITDWLATRDVVRNQYGFDRPPDWDTGPTRGWLPHVSEAGEQARFGRLSLGGEPLPAPKDAMGEEHVVTWVWDAAVVTKLIVSSRSDGSFRVKWRAFPQMELPGIMAAGEYLVDKEWQTTPDVDADEFGSWLDEMLGKVDAVASVAASASGKTVVARMDLAIDRVPDDHADDAIADIIAEFGWAEWAEPFLGDRTTVAETS